MKARLSIQQFELELSGSTGSGRVISADMAGSNADVQAALRMVGRAIAAPLARADDPETSKQAAKRAADFKARDIASIYAALKEHGPMTAYEIAAFVRPDHVAVSRRMRDMVRANLVRDPDTYEHETRPGPTGRQCIVWEAR